MARMLDAAEHLLRTGGPSALTVDAVIEAAGTSTGSFYARFGNREGLFAAMHERFLSGFGSEVGAALAGAAEQSTLQRTIEHFIDGVFTTVRLHRGALAFHVFHNAHDPVMRSQGNELTQLLSAALHHTIEHHHVEPRPVDDATLSAISRMVFAMTLELMLFDDHEVTGFGLTPDQLAKKCTTMAMALLTT